MATPKTVCVIGGGPGGMFFCHALETKRREMMEEGNDEQLPVVTCFERAPAPGGVWRSERTFTSPSNGNEEKKEVAEPAEPTTNMYEALWTNGPKECIEFFDYTFQDHFGDRQLPVYMPRQGILDYLIGRVTKHCPEFFEKYMQFNTNVESVNLWSGGENGKPMMPENLVKMFRDGGFTGRIIHSSDTANFEADCKGKRVLIIGGSYSAEDLALMAIKVGVQKVYISSRDEENAVHWTNSWPEDKVEILKLQTPIAVTENGSCIQFGETDWTFPSDFKLVSEKVQTEIRDIGTVIFCTGYMPNTTMLDQKLSQDVCEDAELKLSVPKDWKMSPNGLTETLGDVEVGDVRWIESGGSFPRLFRGAISISNPSMMFIIEKNFDNPLTITDVNSWLLVEYVTGGLELPSKEEMMRQNEQDALECLDNPYYRFHMDRNYHEAMKRNFDKTEDVLKDYYDDADIVIYRYLARTAHEAEYPVDFGTYEDLSEISETVLEYSEMSLKHRESLTEKDARKRRTFRDCKDSDKFESLFTGAKAGSLPELWLDLDVNDPRILH